jgi:hypothetical protein
MKPLRLYVRIDPPPAFGQLSKKRNARLSLIHQAGKRLLPSTMPVTRTWKLIGPDGNPYASDRPGILGGHRRSQIYGRLDCPAALRAIARGGYIMHRVFFLNEEHAQAAGYRPCAVCLPTAYAAWKLASALRKVRFTRQRPNNG